MTVRIGVRGAVPGALREELAGFVENVMPGGWVLVGSVADQAALLGTLERLHLAGLRIHDVEQLMTPSAGPLPGAGTALPPARGLRARIQVEGRVAALLARTLAREHVAEQPVTTSVEVHLEDDVDLFRLLARLESLALVVREVHIGPEAW